MELRPTQWFSSVGPAREVDPDIGLPTTYKSGTAAEQSQGGAAGHEQVGPAEEAAQTQRSVGRERWSFSPPRTWTEGPGRPLADRKL